MIKKTYIPGKPRNPKLGTATGTSGVGKTEFNQVAGSSHEHYNKGVLDQITEAMLVAALRDLITSTDTESELTDENILSALRVLSEISKANADLLEDLKEQFLSKVEDDTAQGFIEFLRGISVEELATFTQGLEVGTFTTGALGAGAAIKMIDGTSYAEVDNLTVRQKATFRELIIESLKHIGGQLVLTPARMKCVRVVDGGTFYKCYFDTGDGEVTNEFVEGDLARCQVFTGSGTKFYWRLVTLVGEDWINLSKTTSAVGSDAPEAGDDITQLGNATDTTRQSAIILSTVGIDAPSWKQYSGINSFSLEGKETTVFSKLGNRISGETVFTSGGANLDNYLDGVAQDILDALQAAQDAEDKAQQAIEDAEANVATINTEVDKLQAQLDGEVSNWFYAYSPTLANYPASDWTTNEIKDRHVGDTFTNTAQAPATDAGRSWRFVKNGSTYSWTLIADSDAVKALLEASKAQATADGKSTTYLFQPTKYKLGDMWVLNDDHTINGTVYKQGDLLTATQDSESFVQSHWLKRIRYTDDTAIDNLEIGGRNLILNSLNRIGFASSDAASRPIQNQAGSGENYRRFRRTYPEGVTNVGIITYTNEYFTPEKSGYYTYSVYFRPNEFDIELRVRIIASVYGDYTLCKANEWTQVSVTTYIEAGVETRLFGAHGEMPPEAVQWIDYNRVSVTSGNKATDWTPAPEDVEASIETAKTDAENAAKAYADTQAEAERVIAEAYADDIVTAEEQARIDDVNDKLAAAKAYAEAQDALLKIQQEAYADEHISTAEQAAITAAKDYADLKKTEAEAYADGIVSDEEARAIADALEKFNDSKAHAEQLVKDIEIGGRNLIRDSDFSQQSNIDKWTLMDTARSAQPINFGGRHLAAIIINNYEIGDKARIRTGANIPLVKGTTYTISYYGVASVWFNDAFDEGFYKTPDSGYIKIPTPSKTLAGKDIYNGSNRSIYKYTSQFTFDEETTESAFFLLGGITDSGTTNPHWFMIGEIKLEKGNKATDWTPAPEDVEANIAAAKADAENAAKAYADTQAEAERVIAEAYADDIVTAEEQARIDDVNDKLAAAKAYAEAQDALLKTQQEAYADEHISLSEQAAIQAAEDYADLKKTEAQAYADGIVSDEEARAIADALAKFNASKAHAESLVDNLEIGGRNYLRNSDFSKGLDEYWGRLNSSPQENFEIIGTELKVTFNTGTKSDFGRTNFIQENKLEGQDYITISSSIKGTGTLRIRFGSSTMPLQTIDNEEFKRVIFIIPRANFGNGNLIIEISAGELTFNKIKAEAGNKATDWTLSPEDTERELLESQGYMKARYIRSYLKGSNINNNNTWVQIQALTKSGKNVALGKTVTASTTGTNLDRITNGVTDYSNTATVSNTGQVEWVQVDLGKVYYDIDSILHHNYWYSTPPTLADRVFNDTKIEISTDGITWNTIFDSAVSGTYVETKEGKTHTQRHTSVESQGFMRARFVRDWIKGNSVNNRNYWNEIKVVNKAGTNLAKGIIPTSDGSLLNVSYATDDNIDNYTYIATPSTPTLNYLQIDLGAIHYDIDYIHVWHYNGRTFNSTKTEISEDGVTWKTIFDSAVEGTYEETKDGKVHTQRYASVMDRIAETEAKTRFQTLIDGGLIYTALMKLFDTISGDETAFISGKQGAGKNLPAFGAGGSYQDAVEGTAKAIIRHDGTAKFTDAEITGVINALTGEIGNFNIQDGKLKSSYSKSKAIWDYSKFPAEYVGERTVSGEVTVSVDAVELKETFNYQGIPTTTNTRITPDGVSVKSTTGVLLDTTKAELVDGRLSIEVSNTQTGVSSKVEIFSDGIYFNGVKFTGEGGGSDYTHPSTHSASMITAGTLQGIVKANNNTAYTTKQVRNMILSTNDADSSQMANGDIWIKYAP